eukprot:scpid97035/ scgid20901/ 
MDTHCLNPANYYTLPGFACLLLESLCPERSAAPFWTTANCAHVAQTHGHRLAAHACTELHPPRVGTHTHASCTCSAVGPTPLALRGCSLDYQYSAIFWELPTDCDQRLFVESEMTGGVSVSSQLYPAATNPDQEEYGADRQTPVILHLDADTLYGWTMSQYSLVSDCQREKPSKKLLNNSLNFSR